MTAHPTVCIDEVASKSLALELFRRALRFTDGFCPLVSEAHNCRFAKEPRYHDDAKLSAIERRLVDLVRRAWCDLNRIMPEYEPSGDREDAGWQTLRELRDFLIDVGDIHPGLPNTSLAAVDALHESVDEQLANRAKKKKK